MTIVFFNISRFYDHLLVEDIVAACDIQLFFFSVRVSDNRNGIFGRVVTFWELSAVFTITLSTRS